MTTNDQTQRVRAPLPIKMLDGLLTPFRVLASITLGSPTLPELVADVRSLTRAQGRKFNKVEAVYTPVFTVPPLGWEYTCRKCVFFQPETMTCEVVGLRGDPWGGESIGTLAWCSWWLPLEGDPLLKWLPEAIQGQR